MSLDQDFAFYKENQNTLLLKYKGAFLVIKDTKVRGAYRSQIEAYTEGQKQFAPGTFLIQECQPGRESYTQTYHSRVRFA